MRKRKYCKRTIVRVDSSRCPVCGCTDRTPYENIRRVSHGTEQHEINGEVVMLEKITLMRNTRCENPLCGQLRQDVTVEYRTFLSKIKMSDK